MIKGHQSTKRFVFLVFLLLPALVLSECTCDAEDEGHETHDKTKALKYKVVAIASILTGSAIGFVIPMLGKRIPALSPEKDIFFIVKEFAAGVILATGFIHILPDAFENLTSPCLKEHPWSDFPFAGFVAMCTSMGTLMIDAFATKYLNKHHFGKDEVEVADEEKVKEQGQLHVDTHGSHLHGVASSHSSEQQLRQRVISQVLELAIVVHSVVIGLSVGASESPETIKPLVAALTFHQFFEGMGLGSCVAQAKFKSLSIIIMAIFFTLTTPLGIAIGIGITNVYDENSPTGLIVEGILNAASSGILIYMALVDFLAADFMHPRMQNNGTLQIGANISLLLGAGFMSLLAKWA